MLVIVALPGVKPEQVEAAIDGGDLVLAGTRTLPAELASAVIHRLELPQGRFERRLALPGGRYSGHPPLVRRRLSSRAAHQSRSHRVADMNETGRT